MRATKDRKPREQSAVPSSDKITCHAYGRRFLSVCVCVPYNIVFLFLRKTDGNSTGRVVLPRLRTAYNKKKKFPPNACLCVYFIQNARCSSREFPWRCHKKKRSLACMIWFYTVRTSQWNAKSVSRTARKKDARKVCAKTVLTKRTRPEPYSANFLFVFKFWKSMSSKDAKNVFAVDWTRHISVLRKRREKKFFVPYKRQRHHDFFPSSLKYCFFLFRRHRKTSPIMGPRRRLCFQ